MTELEKFHAWLEKNHPTRAAYKTDDNGNPTYRSLLTQGEYQGWLACAERKDAEIAALRGFASIVTNGLDWSKMEIREISAEYGLTDLRGNPTKLLTGEE